MRLVVVLCVMVAGPCVPVVGGRHGFYRGGRRGGGGGGGPRGSRRLFGGSAAPLSSWGAACALLDRYWDTRCSAAVLAPSWALTAAHCISPNVAYVKFNARRPSSPDGGVAPVHFLYKHPEFKVVQEDEGRGLDVTLLHHDVGLVRTRTVMRLSAPLPLEALSAMLLYDERDLENMEVRVLGYGRTESASLGEELFAARMVVSPCERPAWVHCVCGVAPPGAAGAGVCAGDSGGPVVFRGVQVGVTSMGPVECKSDGRKRPAVGATSVFTALRHYVPLLNATLQDADAALGMSRLSRAAPPAAHRAALLLPLVLVLPTARY